MAEMKYLPASGLIHIEELSVWFGVKPASLVKFLRKESVPIIACGTTSRWSVRLEDLKGTTTWSTRIHKKELI